MEASEKPQLPLDRRPTRRRRAGARGPDRDRGADDQRRARRAGGARARRGRDRRPPRRSPRRSRSAPGCSTARRPPPRSTTSKAEFEHAHRRAGGAARAKNLRGVEQRAGDRREEIAREPSTPAAERRPIQHQIRGDAGAQIADREQRDEQLMRRFSADDGANPLADFKQRVVMDALERRRGPGQRESEEAASRSRRADPRDRRAHRARPGPRGAWSPRPRRPAPARAAASRSGSHEALERDRRRPRRRRLHTGARQPRAAARRATRWSSSARPTARRRAGSCSRPRTRSSPRTTPGGS